MSNPEPLFISAPLLRQAARLCEAFLANNPTDVPNLISLARIYRKQGRLTEATALYARLLELNPDDAETIYMHSILTGVPLPAAPAGTHPAPFVLIRDFLPASFHEMLLPFAQSVQDKLVPALVGNFEYKPDSRESLDLPGRWEVKTRFHVIVRDMVPQITAQLHRPPFEVGDLEVKLRAYLDGHFFRIHMDCPANSEQNRHRKVSYVYFFHKQPRAYEGGDLVLYDTDVERNKFTTSAFTRVVPQDNSIIFFPSCYFHGVVPVSCLSKQFIDSRFVINGHVSNRVAAKPGENALAENSVDTFVGPSENASPAVRVDSPATSSLAVASS